MKKDKISNFKEYGESILQKIDLVLKDSAFQTSLQESWVSDSGLPNLLPRLHDTAQKTVETASSPVKIGVMGEFSAGKTLLLGSLIGYADALPVSETPTTGNVTAIHLVPQDGLQTTQVHLFTVEYLDEQGVNKCLRHMLNQAATRTRAAGLSSFAEKIQDFHFGNDELIENIIDWCRQVWNASNNPELRFLIRELVIFVHTYKAYKGSLCNYSKVIDPVTAKEGLKLTPPPNNIQSLNFSHIEPTLDALDNRPEQLTARQLQLSFSLIRRVTVEVKISKEIWNLSPLQGVNEFILLDFPGLGAANSGVRDTFLSLSELEKVQTIMILLDGKSPGSDRAGKIFNMLEQQKQGKNIRDRIIVGVGRFDELPLKNDGEDKVLQDLIGDRDPVIPFVSSEQDPLLLSQEEPLMPSQDERIEEATVLEKLKVLGTTIATAESFTTRKDRILLLSPLLGLAEFKKRSRTIQVGSQEFIARLEEPGFLDEAERMRSYWDKLSKKLLETNPRSHLGKQLSYFANDGGMGKLRELLQNHVDEYGLQQVYEDTHSAAEGLRQEQEELKITLNQIKEQGIPVEENPDVVKLREITEKLYNIYDDFQRNLGKEPLKDRSLVPFSEVVHQELTSKIYHWDEWNSLFQRAEDGIIIPPTEEDLLGKAVPGLDPPEENKKIPATSDDFYSSFARTIQELEVFTRSLSRQAVTDLLNTLTAKVSPQGEEILKILPREKIQERINKLKEKYGSPRKLQVLSGVAIKPILLQDYIFTKCKLQQEQTDTNYTINPDNLFPLVRPKTFDWVNKTQAKNNKNSQTFKKTTNSSQEDAKAANHQILVLRLRDEMIACAGLKLVELVSEVNQQLNHTLGELLNGLIDELQALLKNEALLRDIATENLQTNGDPTWLQILDSITSIAYPNPI